MKTERRECERKAGARRGELTRGNVVAVIKGHIVHVFLTGRERRGSVKAIKREGGGASEAGRERESEGGQRKIGGERKKKHNVGLNLTKDSFCYTHKDTKPQAVARSMWTLRVGTSMHEFWPPSDDETELEKKKHSFFLLSLASFETFKGEISARFQSKILALSVLAHHSSYLLHFVPRTFADSNIPSW